MAEFTGSMTDEEKTAITEDNSNETFLGEWK
jgi:hypothetical protein